MKINMSVTLETPDGEKTDRVVADARDIRNYESEFGASWVTTDTSYTQTTQLAYVAMKRRGSFKGSWDVFDSQCTDIEGAPDEVEVSEPANPTSTGRAAGRSSR